MRFPVSSISVSLGCVLCRGGLKLPLTILFCHFPVGPMWLVRHLPDRVHWNAVLGSFHPMISPGYLGAPRPVVLDPCALWSVRLVRCSPEILHWVGQTLDSLAAKRDTLQKCVGGT